MASELIDRLQAIFPAEGGFGEPNSTFIFGASFGFPITGLPQMVTRFILQDRWVQAETQQVSGPIFHAPGPHQAIAFGAGEVIVRSYDWLLSTIYLGENVREIDPLWKVCATENEATAIDALHRSEPDVIQDAMLWFKPLRPTLPLILAR